MAREISKRFEETVTGTLAELAARYARRAPKGEIVIVVGPPGEAEAAGEAELDAALREALARLSAVARRGRGRRAARRAEARRPTSGRWSSNEPGSGRSAAAAGPKRLAAWWLRLKGWRILGRRVRTPVGEVDLVARRGRTLAFVEVKARATARRPASPLDEYRLRRVAAAAEALAPRYARDGDDIRIDAIFIVPRRLPRHLANVWQG